jgi:hypothetical protein
VHHGGKVQQVDRAYGVDLAAGNVAVMPPKSRAAVKMEELRKTSGSSWLATFIAVQVPLSSVAAIAAQTHFTCKAIDVGCSSHGSYSV